MILFSYLAFIQLTGENQYSFRFVRARYAETSKTYRETRQPAIITVKRRGNAVMLYLQDYRQMKAELELLQVLADSEADVAAGRVEPMEDTFRDLRTRLTEKNDG